MFSLLGQIPTSDLDPYAAAALADIPLPNARSLLEDLVDAHLLQEPAPNRYRQHDLLREHARGIAAESREDALTRLFDYYVRTAVAATNVLYPDTSHLRPQAAGADRFASVEAALGWLDAERANLMVVGAYTADHGWPSHSSTLAASLYPYLDGHAHHADALDLYSAALRASRSVGDKAGEANALLARIVMNWRQGRYEQAYEYAERALYLSYQLGDLHVRAQALACLGSVRLLQRDYVRARDYLHQALRLARSVGDRLSEAIVLGDLGRVDSRQEQFESARSRHELALEIFRSIGSPCGGATALNNLGLLCARLGDHDKAGSHYRQALELCLSLGFTSGEAGVLNGLGEVALATGVSAEAVADHALALSRAAEGGNRPEQARAHAGLARAYLGLGDVDKARHHAKHALDLYLLLSVPEADEAEAFLKALD